MYPWGGSGADFSNLDQFLSHSHKELGWLPWWGSALRFGSGDLWSGWMEEGRGGLCGFAAHVLDGCIPNMEIYSNWSRLTGALRGERLFCSWCVRMNYHITCTETTEWHIQMYECLFLSLQTQPKIFLHEKLQERSQSKRKKQNHL